MDNRVARLIAFLGVALMCTSALGPAMHIAGAAMARVQITSDGLQWADDKRITNTPSLDMFPQIWVDRTVNTQLIWLRDSNFMYIGLDDQGRIQGSELKIAPAQIPMYYNGQFAKSVSIDGEGNIHMIYLKNGNYGALTYQKYSSSGKAISQPIDISLGRTMSSGVNLVTGKNNYAYVIMNYFGPGGMEKVAFDRIDKKFNFVSVNISDDSWYVDTSTFTMDKNDQLRILMNVWYGATLGIWAKTVTADGQILDESTQYIYSTSNFASPPMPAMAACSDNTLHLLRSSSWKGGGTLTYVKLNAKNIPVAGIDNDIVVTQNAADSGDIGCDSLNNIYIVWANATDGNLYYEKISPGTENETHDVIQLTTRGTAKEPKLAVDHGGSPHVVWRDTRDGNDEIYYKLAYNPGAELSMSPSEMAKLRFIHAEEIKSVNVTIKNTGGLNDTFLLNVTADPQGYDKAGCKVWPESDSVDLDSLKTSRFQVFIKGPNGCDMFDHINIRITATSEKYPSKNASITIGAWAICCTGISVSFADNVHVVGAGESTVFVGNVKNGGDMKENIIFTLDGPDGWDFKLNVTEALLKPRTTMSINLTVMSPPDAQADEIGEVRVEGRSVERPQVKGIGFTRTVIRPELAIGLTIDDPLHYVDPGNATEFMLKVSNKGNLPGTEVIVVEIVSDIGDWTAFFDRTSVGLASKREDTVKVTVISPRTAKADTRFVVTIKAFGNTMTDWCEATATIIVNRIHRLDISAVPGSATVDPGETANYQLRVTNLGNADELLEPGVSGLQLGWSLKYKLGGVAATGVLLAPGASVTLSIDVQVPVGAMSGSYDITGRFTDEEGINWTVPLVTTVAQIFLVDMYVVRSIGYGIPGGTIIFDCKVKNLGNGPDTIDLGTKSLSADWNAQYVINGSVVDSVGLEALGSTIAQLVVKIPFDAIGSSELFSATSTSSGGIRSEVALVVNVGLPNLKMISVTYLPTTFKKDGPASIKVLIKNEGGSDCEDVEVRFYEGDQQMDSQTIKIFPAGTEKVVVFAWVPQGTGDYKLRYVIDPENRIVETDKTDNVLTGKVTVGSHSNGFIPGFEGPALVMAIVVMVILASRKRNP